MYDSSVVLCCLPGHPDNESLPLFGRRIDHLWYAELHGAEGIVGVHECMDGVVHHHEPAARRSVVCVAVPHVDEHAHVMVPMQEDELLLAEDDEDCVTEFVHLRYGEHIRPEADGAVEVGRAAHRVLPTILPDRSGSPDTQGPP